MLDASVTKDKLIMDRQVAVVREQIEYCNCSPWCVNA